MVRLQISYNNSSPGMKYILRSMFIVWSFLVFFLRNVVVFDWPLLEVGVWSLLGLLGMGGALCAAFGWMWVAAGWVLCRFFWGGVVHTSLLQQLVFVTSSSGWFET